MNSSYLPAIIDYNISNNGYIKFFNKLLIQWGITAVNSDTGTITYPVEFLTIFCTICNVVYNVEGGYDSYILSQSTSSFVAGKGNNNGNDDMTWIAFGLAL